MSPSLAYANIAAFYIAQIAVSVYAIARGGAPERLVGGLLLTAAAATSIAPVVFGVNFDHVAWALFAVDLPLLVALWAVAAFSDRYWPMWLAALQILAVGNHGVRAYDLSILNYAYWLIAGKLAYPMLLVLLIGTIRHRRRLNAGAPEYGWTFQRLRS